MRLLFAVQDTLHKRKRDQYRSLGRGLACLSCFRHAFAPLPSIFSWNVEPLLRTLLSKVDSPISCWPLREQCPLACKTGNVFRHAHKEAAPNGGVIITPKRSHMRPFPEFYSFFHPFAQFQTTKKGRFTWYLLG